MLFHHGTKTAAVKSISVELFRFSTLSRLYRLRIDGLQHVMWLIVSTHTRSLVFTSAWLKTKDNPLKKLVIQSLAMTPAEPAEKERTFL